MALAMSLPLRALNNGRIYMTKDDGWIEWHGGECPVPQDAWVSAQYRRGIGGDTADAVGRAGGFCWKHYGGGLDLVRYHMGEPVHISKAAEPTKPDTRAEDALWHRYALQAITVLLPSITEHSPATYARDAADLADTMLAEARKRGRV